MPKGGARPGAGRPASTGTANADPLSIPPTDPKAIDFPELEALARARVKSILEKQFLSKDDSAALVALAKFLEFFKSKSPMRVDVDSTVKIDLDDILGRLKLARSDPPT